MNRFLNLLINAHTKLKIVSQKSDGSSEILERNLAVRPHQMQNNEAEDLTILPVYPGPFWLWKQFLIL